MTPLWRIGIAAGVLATALACGKPQSALVAPRLYQAAGDTALFGPGPVSLDDRGRVADLELREPGTVLLYYFNARGRLTFVGGLKLAAGRHHNALPTVGGRPAQSGIDAWLVVVTREDIATRNLGQTSTPYQLDERNSTRPATSVSADYALNTLPVGLQRRLDSPWASWLVGP